MKAYEYPKEQNELSPNWYENPQGIFSLDIRQGTVEVSLTAPADIYQGTDTDLCNASITVPDATYSGGTISWVMSGATTGSDTGQVGTRTFEKGTTLINYTVKDAEGNTSHDSMEITVNDDQEPELITENTLSGSTDTGQCTASVSVPTVSFSDNCPGENLSWTMSGATSGQGTEQVGAKKFNIGTTIISYTVTDAAGNSTTQELEVTVNDEQYPQLTVGSTISETTDSGQCSASISVPTVTFSDNCSGESLSWKMSGATSDEGPGQVGTKTFNIGTTTISYTVIDAANNITSGFLSITVSDRENPSITAPAPVSGKTGDDGLGNCSTTIALGVPPTSDNCDEITVKALVGGTEIDPTTYAFNPGSTVVTWEATDKAGNIATATQTITITDDEKPVIFASSDIATSNDVATCGASVDIVPATATDNCAVGEPTGTRLDGQPLTALYPIGTTTISWTVTDSNGNEANPVLQTVTIKDNEKPVVTAGADLRVPNDSGFCYASLNDLTASASDNCEVVTPVGIRSDGQPLNASYPIGTTIVTWNVKDANGNAALPVEQKVIVEDKAAPTISAPAALLVSTDAGSCIATGLDLGMASTVDNCGSVSITNDAPSAFPIGETIVTWTVTDESANTSTDVQLVTVEDNEAPVITAPERVNFGTDAGSCNATGIDLDTPTISDNCEVASITNDAPDSFPLGETPVTWTVTDNSGNSSSAIQIITVKDDEIPVLSAKDDIVVYNIPGACNAAVTIEIPLATDNCSVNVPKGTRSDGKALTSKYPVGETIVVWQVKDAGGNEALPVEQKITVVDKEAPVAPVLEDLLSACEITASIPETSDNCAGTIQGTTTDELTYSAPGTHIITWLFEDGNGNSTIAEQRIIIDPLEVEQNVMHVLCNGFSTGGIELATTGGVGPYTYAWATLGSGEIKNNLAAGTYSVVVTDAMGCSTDSLEIIIEEPDTFIEIKGITYTTGCYQQSNATATVYVTGGTGEYSYLWSDGQISRTAEDLTPGTYTVTVTDQNGCEATKSIMINEPEELVIPNVSTTLTTSFGTSTGTATANVSGGTGPYVFQWSNGNTGQIARDLAAGTYQVTVTDANQCSYTREFTIYDPLEATIVPASLCLTEEGGIRTSKFETENVRGGNGSYTYEWDFGLDATPATGSGPGPIVVEYSSTGDKIITLTVTDTNGLSVTKTLIQYVGECFETCGNTSNFDIELQSFYIGREDGTPLTSADCSSPEKKYIFLKSVANANAYSPMVEYIYTLSDGNGTTTSHKVIACLAEYDEGTKQYKKIPELINLGEVADWSCGYRIEMENFFMSWTNNFKRGCGENPRMMCLSTNEDDEIIYPLYITATKRDLLCYNVSTGTITAVASGGRGAYQYSLDGTTWQSSNIFGGLEAGTYTVTVRDGVGDTLQSSLIEIAEPDDPLVIVKPVEMIPVTCHGGSDGSATVHVTGGTPFETGEPYIYVWSNSETTATATGLSAGEYQVTVIDKNGCELTETIVIEQPDQIPANAGSDIILPCGVNNTQIGTSIPEGEPGSWTVVNGPAGWNIEDPSNTVTNFSGNIGTYTLRWTESCGSADDVKIVITDCSTIDFDGQDDYIEFGDNYDRSDEFSLEAWTKLQSLEGVKTVISKRDVANLTNDGYDLIVENGNFTFRWNGNSITSPYPIDTNRWYHLAVTSGSNETKLYIDGIEVIDGAAASPGSSENPFMIGAMFNSSRNLTPENYFHGWIEEVRIWNISLTKEQIRFMMNQKLEDNGGKIRGRELPLNVPGDPDWSSLEGYYHMEKVLEGYTIGETSTSVRGKLRNITTVQIRTAPLPYVSKRNGNWRITAPSTTPWLYGDGVWDAPNSLGVTNDTINWNIVRVSHDISSGNQDITVLGLLSEKGRLRIFNPAKAQDEYNPGHSLRVTRYLDLNGVIDLVGESQLLQDEGSLLEENSTGFLERDQQGTASSYNYNYWTSPVSTSTGNVPFSIAAVMKDGTTTSPRNIDFGPQYHYADGAFTTPRKVSTYWLHKFHGTANNYFAWEDISITEGVPVGEGFSMKGTSGYASPEELQNYTFVGVPNNGTIKLKINETPEGENYLVGNPYPSALNARVFIEENIADDISRSAFNGTLYFWDHFAKTSHYLEEYIGGYAVYNLAGSIEPASSVDSRIDNSGPSRTGSKRPGDYIPVGQAFFVNTVVRIEGDEVTSTGGDTIRFTNNQRIYKREIDKDEYGNPASVFHSQERKDKKASVSKESRKRIWIKSRSPLGYHRQLLVTADQNTSENFDLGYDAPLMDDTKEDMYWLINNSKFVIQGVPDFNKSRVLPLGILVHEEGEITIAIDELENISADFGIYLKDSLTGITHDLRKETFTATAPAGTIHDRFSIVFQEETPEENEEPRDGSSPDPADNSDEKDGKENTNENTSEVPEIFYSNRDSEIVIKNPENLPIKRGMLYNGLGQRIIEFKNISSENLVRLPVRLNITGVYIFNLEFDSGSKSVKFIVE